MEIHMTPQGLAARLREAFGEKARLPLAFWYGDEAVAKTERTPGCLFKALARALTGEMVSLDEGNVACGGGRFYAGFCGFMEHIPAFVSVKERYKETPGMVESHIRATGPARAERPHLNFVRIDILESLDDMEGLLFFATPDVLSGLVSWAHYDSNGPETVSAPFGSGCSTVITMAVNENRKGGNRVFLGLFDPSVRPYVGENELGLAIPRSRFLTMQDTLEKCCLTGTHAWAKVRERINRDR